METLDLNNLSADELTQLLKKPEENRLIVDTKTKKVGVAKKETKSDYEKQRLAALTIINNELMPEAVRQTTRDEFFKNHGELL